MAKSEDEIFQEIENERAAALRKIGKQAIRKKELVNLMRETGRNATADTIDAPRRRIYIVHVSTVALTDKVTKLLYEKFIQASG